VVCIWILCCQSVSTSVPSGESLNQSEHFRSSAWLLNVASVGNFTPFRDYLIGRQFRLAMESAWFARSLGRGWVSPRFVHQQRNNTLVEEMIENSSAVFDQHPHIINTKAVPCESLFDCRPQVLASYTAKYLTLEQLHVESAGVIDHLLVQEPAIIGRQACNVPTSQTEGPSIFEFFGLEFVVKRVSCFPND
jgi:hypothetical protein